MSLFGRIAIEKGLLTEVQLQRALKTQEEIRALGLSKPLGVLLVKDGALKEEDVALIIRLQKINEQRKHDRKLSKVVVRNGLASQAAVDEALEAVKAGGFRKGLGETLVERGVLTAQTERAVKAALERARIKAEAAEAAGVALDGDTPAPIPLGPTTARLGATLVVDETDSGEGTIAGAGKGLDLEKRIRDVLFAAVALREGLVLVPELERALREQARLGADMPLLETVLGSRGVLAPAELASVERAIEASRTEKITIPGYLVTDVLGRGATSIVLRARHELIDREVAIKLFRTEHVAATDADALVDEARTIAKIRHPNVVGLYDVGRVHRRIYYVMELVDGPTLLDEIARRGRLPERESLKRAREIARALEAIHAAGLVHRDVKPQNVLLPRAGGPGAKLTDLGLAREADRPDNLPNAVFGSPHTLSPEQVQGDAVDIRADLYGLGATLFYALAGSPPYDGKDPVSVMTRHVTDAIPDLRERCPDVSVATASLVTDLLAKKREDRPANPTEVVARISVLLGDPSDVGPV